MSFDLDKFTAESSVELLNLGKKTDLLNLAKHYKLSEIESSMRKHEIKNIWSNILLMRRFSIKILFP